MTEINVTGWSARRFIGNDRPYWKVYDQDNKHVATISPNRYFGGYGFDFHAAHLWSLRMTQLRDLIDPKLDNWYWG